MDQAIEFPLPDEEGRAKLIRLYSHGLFVADDVTEATVKKTENVSASFIKELMRRSAQFQIERNAETPEVTRSMRATSGIIVNMVLLAALTDVGGLYYLLSAVVATQGSTLWNFAFPESWVFGERFRGRGRLGRLGKFLLMNNGALLLRGPFLLFLTSGLGVHYLISKQIASPERESN